MTKRAKQIVFIVDNEPKVCETICDTLQASGVTARCFTNPLQCLDRIFSEGCDLLITALKMPQICGIELLRQAKLLIPWLTVVIISAYGDVPTAVKTAQAGAVDFIEMPLVKDDFIKKVKSLLPTPDNTHGSLTKAEVSVLRMVAMGKSSGEIAYLLHRSSRTIELHRRRAMHKLGLRDFTDLLKRIGGGGVPEFLATEEGKNASVERTENGQ